MQIFGYSLLFLMIMATIAVPPLVLITGPILCAVIKSRRSTNRKVAHHRARYDQSQTAMKLAKAVR